MDLVDLLRHHHRQAQAILTRLADGDATAASELGELLRRHVRVEEQVAYPALVRELDVTSQEVRETLGRHRRMRDLADDLSDAQTIDLASRRRAAELARMVDEHVAADEEILLRPAVAQLPARTRAALGSQAVAVQAALEQAVGMSAAPRAWTASSGRGLRIGMVSTHPPTLCGLATFSMALRRAWERQGHHVAMVRIVEDDREAAEPADVAGLLRVGSELSTRRAVRTLSDCDVAVIQHEFGIYGGRDGQDVLELARGVDAPLIVVLHTVLEEPSEHQAEILVELTSVARWTVVMSDAARERLLLANPRIDEDSVITIPHGAAVPAWPAIADGPEQPAPGLLTWGLIGPGKGIEHVIDALGLLREHGQSVQYTIAGATHPKVAARDGEQYKDMLRARAQERGVADLVTFDSSYRSPDDMTQFIAASGIVVLPYDSRDQVTSGVLVDSIAAGRPVIATRFPHAVELLREGVGLLVPHQSPNALAVAIRTLTTEPDTRASLTEQARRLAPTLSWDCVGRQYVELCQLALERRTGLRS